MTYRTVQRLADAARPEGLFQGQWQSSRTKLDAFKPYLHERWAEGCTNAWSLWEEIKNHGYTGGYGAVRAYLQLFRTSPTTPAARPPSPRTVTGWILRHPDTVSSNCPHTQLTSTRKKSSGRWSSEMPAISPQPIWPRSPAVKRRLKQIQYRPDIVDGCLDGTGPAIHG